MSPRRWALVAATALYACPPALAAVDPAPASTKDGRMRLLEYDQNNPVQVFAAPGASVRIVFAPDEKIVAVVVSDEGIIKPEYQPEASGLMSSAGFGDQQQGAAKTPASCDANLCRNVTGNMVYLKPSRPLTAQPLFIQTMRCLEPGSCDLTPAVPTCDPRVCETVGYPFELATRDTNTTWSIGFTYPARERATKARELQRQRAAWMAGARERAALAPAPPSVPQLASNWRYGYSGDAATKPDDAWDDGRSTYLRYSGNRRVPVVYRREPNGDKALATYSVEPDAGGNTLRISHTDSKWWVEQSNDVGGCIFGLGPDPQGASSNTVKVGAR